MKYLLLLLLAPSLLYGQSTLDAKLRAKSGGYGLTQRNFSPADSVLNRTNATTATQALTLAQANSTSLTSQASKVLSLSVGNAVNASTISNLSGLLASSNTELSVLANASTKNQVSGINSAVGITFVTSSTLTFNTFAFPGHNFTDSRAVFAVAYLKTTAGVTEIKTVPFDKRTTDYKFQFSRTYALTEGVAISFGYCDIDLNTFATGVGTLLWASSTADANLSSVRVRYIDPSTCAAITCTGITSGSPGWVSTPYKLLTTIVNLGAGGATEPQPYQIVLPPKLYGLATSNYWLYEDSYIQNAHVFEKAPVRLTLSAKKVSDGTTITPYAQITGITQLSATEPVNLTMTIQSYSKTDSTYASAIAPRTTLTKAISYSVITPPTSKTLNALVIGDSYVDIQYGDGMLKYVTDFITASGNTVNFKGLRTSYGIKHEARAGWSEVTFFRYVPTATRIAATGSPSSVLMSSPFMFSTNDTEASAVFSFSQYLSTNSIGSLDVVMIFLGMNGGDGSYIDQMITSIKSALPSAKVLVCMVPPAERDRMNFDSNARQTGRLNQNNFYLTRFAGRESSGIYLVPTHMGFSRRYGLIGYEQGQVQFNLTGVPTKYIANDHHPTPTGNKGMAYMESQYLLYIAP